MAARPAFHSTAIGCSLTRSNTLFWSRIFAAARIERIERHRKVWNAHRRWPVSDTLVALFLAMDVFLRLRFFDLLLLLLQELGLLLHKTLNLR